MQLNLVWSWNNEVRFACFEKVEEVVAQGDYKGQKSQYLEMNDSRALNCDNEVVMIGFIGASLMVIIYIFSLIWLVNTSDLHIYDKNVEIKDIKKLNFNVGDSPIIAQSHEIHYVHDYHSKERIKSGGAAFSEDDLHGFNDDLTKSLLDHKRKIFQNYSGSFFIKYKEHSLFILCEKTVSICQLSKWKDQVTDMVEKAEWKPAMDFIIKIYQGKNKFVDIIGYSKNER